MADREVLKRLGGGRWKTADDRFTVEPQSGSWAVVDTQQTDDLGLPLVRGPFGSLTAARASIETARAGDAPVSPLAARVEEERRHPRPAKLVVARVGPAAATAPPLAKPATTEHPKPPMPPPPPPEPAWIGQLPVARRSIARHLIARLADAGVTRAEEIAREEVGDGQPAVARAALDQQLRRAIERHPTDRDALVAEVIGLLAAGEDEGLGARWRLVDGEGRSMAPLRGIAPDRP